MSETRRKILVMVDWYLPGYRGGGPIRSVANIVAALKGDYEFSVVTSALDYGVKEPYAGVPMDEWVEGPQGERVWYCSPEGSTYRHIRSLIAREEFDVLYLNSMFSLRFTIFPLWAAHSTQPEARIILAPRGMLHPGALGLKPTKKKFFLTVIKLLGFHKRMGFHATDAEEATHIRKVFGEEARIVEAPNLPKPAQGEFVALNKEKGSLRMLFLSRISEKKGVHALLEALRGQTGNIELDICGPDQELGYWERCQRIISALPPNVQVRKMEAVAPAEAEALYRQAHVFAMPTLGENFGHAIFEALAAGRPVLVSDQTPWKGLAAAKAGMDIPVSAPGAWEEAIAQFAAMDQGEWETWARGAYALAAGFLQQGDRVERNRQLFAEGNFPTFEGKPDGK